MRSREILSLEKCSILLLMGLFWEEGKRDAEERENY